MAIFFNDNIRVNAGKPVDAKYLNNLSPYTGVTQANSLIPISERHIGLTVNVNGDEYWYATGVTNTDLVFKNAIGNSERIFREFTQTGHGFSVGDAVALSGNTFIQALADGSQIDAETVGIVTNSGSTDRFTVTFAGYATGINVATSGLTYYVSPSTAGALTPIEPVVQGQVNRPIYYAITNNTGIVLQYRSELNFTGGTGTTIVTGVTDGFNVGGGVEVFKNVSGITTMLFRTLQGSGNTFVVQNGDSILIGVSGGTGSTNVLGPARDGTYADGLFPFTNVTPVGFAVDDINEFLLNIAPTPAPRLDFIDTSTVFQEGKLSFGSTNSISGFFNVQSVGITGNGDVDINEEFVSGSTGDNIRLGLIKTGSTVVGVLNEDVIGGVGNIPFADNAFGRADEGILELELNGINVNSLDLSSTTGATASTIGDTTINVGAVQSTRFDNGQPFEGGQKYRIGSFLVNSGAMRNGWNYMRVSHSGISPVTQTNYLEWVFDNDSTVITYTGESFSSFNLTGSTFISGVEYHTGGTVTHSVTGNSVYLNVFSSNATAITYPTRTNLAATPDSITVTGDSILSGSTQALPDLNSAILDPEDTSIHIQSDLSVNNNIVVGSVGTTGTISANISIDHPFSDEVTTTTGQTETGFLLYGIVQPDNDTNEDFTGETNRLITDDYVTGVTYGVLTGITGNWDSTQSLILGDAGHNNGLLIFNGELQDPNGAYLTTQYGITTGDFSLMTNGPAGNPDYSLAAGEREYYRRFTSTNTTTQSTISINITNTGNASNFLTGGGETSSPSGDNIALEFVIKRANGSTHGWANPFASTGNPEGIANISTSHAGGVTTVSATLSTVPRIAVGDFVIVRVRAASGWTNRISNIEITNI
jgi:hypothetical protein